MIRRIVEFALHQPLLTGLALAIFVACGYTAFSTLPIEAFPDVSDIQTTIVTQYPGRAAEEVEQQVTIPLEIALAGLPHAVRMFSHTQFGLSYIVITFDDGTTDLLARAQVLERLHDADMPQGVQPELQALATAIGEIYRYTVSGPPGMAPRELRTLQDWVVDKQLRQVPGVADINTLGGAVKQYVVSPDLARLRDAGITLPQLYQALSRANANAGGGAVAQGSQQYLLRGIGLMRNVDDIGEVVVNEAHGVPVRVRDVATVTIGSAAQQGIIVDAGGDDEVTGIVLMRKGENPSNVLDGIHAKIDEINRSMLPRGVQIKPYYDRAWLIDRTLHTVFHNLLEGALLVSGVLFLFLGNLRAALIVALVIPLALLSTFTGLKLIGIPANLLSLGAMDFGILVDGAVIVMENIFRHLSERHASPSPRDRRAVVLDAAIEVGRPTLFSMIIIIAAHLPIFTLQRHEGRIFAPMAYSVTSALIGSLIASLTVVPLLAWLGLRKVGHEDTGIVALAKRRYRPLLTWALDHRGSVLGIALSALAGSFVVGSMLGSEFLPELNEGSIWVNIPLPPGISVEESRAMGKRIFALLHEVPEVDEVLYKAGRPDDGTDPKLINATETLVTLKPESQWRDGASKESLIEEMDAKLRTLPGLDPAFSQPIRDNVLESISQVDGQIVLKLFGDDLDQLNRMARTALAEIRAVPGVAEAAIDREGQLPQMQLDIDRRAAARYGLNIADVQDIIETALGGKAATELYEGERHFSVVVRLAESQRALDHLRDVLVPTPDGAQVPLRDLVQFRTTSGAQDIARENGQRVVAIGIFIRDRDMGSVVADAQKAVEARLQMPEGYRMVWSGEFESQRRAMTRLAIVVPLSVAVIFMLLVNAFGSMKSAALIIANVPFALIGGILALAITGLPLSVSAAIGFIALFGQAVLNGVVLVSHFDQLRNIGLGVREAVMQGAVNRLRTVMMTALLAMLGLLPMALSTAIGAETQRPLAIVVIGGLVSATLLTVLVLPTVYLWLYERSHRAEMPS